MINQLSHYAPVMVKKMWRRISLFVAGLGRSSRKEIKGAMLIGEMDICRLMVYVQHVEEGKLRGIEEYRSKEAKIGNDSG